MHFEVSYRHTHESENPFLAYFRIVIPAFAGMTYVIYSLAQQSVSYLEEYANIKIILHIYCNC
jgi:hypothetical protein